MPEFKREDICEIVDVGEGDIYFPKKDEFIGNKVEFRWYDVSSKYGEQDGFFSCMVYVCDEYENLEKSIRRAIFFERVKLKKVV